MGYEAIAAQIKGWAVRTSDAALLAQAEQIIGHEQGMRAARNFGEEYRRASDEAEALYDRLVAEALPERARRARLCLMAVRYVLGDSVPEWAEWADAYIATAPGAHNYGEQGLVVGQGKAYSAVGVHLERDGYGWTGDWEYDPRRFVAVAALRCCDSMTRAGLFPPTMEDMERIIFNPCLKTLPQADRAAFWDFVQQAAIECGIEEPIPVPA